MVIPKFINFFIGFFVVANCTAQFSSAILKFNEPTQHCEQSLICYDLEIKAKSTPFSLGSYDLSIRYNESNGQTNVQGIVPEGSDNYDSFEVYQTLSADDEVTANSEIDIEAYLRFVGTYATDSNPMIIDSTDFQPLINDICFSIESKDYYQNDSLCNAIKWALFQTSTFKTIEDNPVIIEYSSVEECAAFMCIEVTCPINTGVYLEGAMRRIGYGSYMNNMRNDLTTYGLLPGQDPRTGFGQKTEVGQPFKEVFNYYGSEGDTVTQYTSDVVDWVLIDVRSNIDVSTNLCRMASVVLEDGSIDWRYNGCDCELTDGEEVYLVIHHRNHLPVISEQLLVENGSISFDFRNQQSHIIGFNSGQRRIDENRYVMIGGNGYIFDENNYADVNAVDISYWESNNSFSDLYSRADYDMNSDINSNDKFVLIRSNGLTSSVKN